MHETSKELAIDGGAPVRETSLPYARPIVDEADIAAVSDVLRSGWLTTGPVLDAFEADFARAVGADCAVAVNSGTAALHVAYVAAGLGPGDEIITSPLTFCATANAALYCGATPVFADVDAERLVLDPAAVERALTPRTRAIVAVDYAGHPAPIAALADLAQARGLALIEDAAHSIGATSGGQPVGSLAPFTTFSLHPVKHVAAGEGGVVTTNDAAAAERMRRLRNHGLDRSARQRHLSASWRYDAVELGWNYRLSEIHAALARGQLTKLEANLATRRRLVRDYDRRLADIPGVVRPRVAEGCVSAWHLYPIRLDLERLDTDRDALVDALRAEGIGAQVHYPLVSDLTLYRARGADPGATPVAQDAAARLVSLPLFHGMVESDVCDAAVALDKVCRGYGA